MFGRVLILSVVLSCLFASSVEAQLFRRRAARQRYAQTRNQRQPVQTRQYQRRRVQRQQSQLAAQQQASEEQLRASQLAEARRATTDKPTTPQQQTKPASPTPATVNSTPRSIAQQQAQRVSQPGVAGSQNRAINQPQAQTFSQPSTIGSVAAQPQPYIQRRPSVTIAAPGPIAATGQFDIARQRQTINPVQQAGGNIVLNAPLPTAAPASLNAPLATAPVILQSPTVNAETVTTTTNKVDATRSKPTLAAPLNATVEKTTVSAANPKNSKKSYSVLERDN